MMKMIKKLDSRFISWCAKEGLETKRVYAYSSAVVGTLLLACFVLKGAVTVISFFNSLI